MDEILTFWFPEGLEPKFWFLGAQNPETDKMITELFGEMLNNARLGLLKWKEDYNSLLASIILFDQVTRHVNRGKKDIIDADGEIAVMLSMRFIDLLRETKDPPISHIVFGTIPLRHSKQPEYLYYQDDFIEVMKKKHDYLHGTLWTKFENKNNEVFHCCCFNKPVAIVKDWRNLTDLYETYADVLDSDVVKNWDFEKDITGHSLYDIVIESLKKFVPEGKKEVGISISGGVDSMNIAHIVAKAGYTPICLHIDYGNRDVSDREAEFVGKFCTEIGAILYSVPIKFFRRWVTKREDYESITKRIRFSMYKFIIEKYDLSVIAMGHHKGDIAENVFTNIIRASNLRDPMVIEELKVVNNVPLWRPMISVYKDAIFDFAHIFGVPYMKDTTPDEVARGKMRRRWFPSIREHYPSLDDKLIDVGRYYRGIGDILESHIINPFIDKVVYCKYGFYVDYTGFEDGNPLIWNEFLMKILHSHGHRMLSGSSVRTLLSHLKTIDYKKHSDHLHFMVITWNNCLIFIDKKMLPSDKTSDVIGLEFDTEKDGWRFSVVPHEGDEKNLTLEELLDGKGCYTINCDEDDFVICRTVPRPMKKRMKNPLGNINFGLLSNFFVIIPELVPDHPVNSVKVFFEKID